MTVSILSWCSNAVQYGIDLARVTFLSSSTPYSPVEQPTSKGVTVVFQDLSKVLGMSYEIAQEVVIICAIAWITLWYLYPGVAVKKYLRHRRPTKPAAAQTRREPVFGSPYTATYRMWQKDELMMERIRVHVESVVHFRGGSSQFTLNHGVLEEYVTAFIMRHQLVNKYAQVPVENVSEVLQHYSASEEESKQARSERIFHAYQWLDRCYAGMGEGYRHPPELLQYLLALLEAFDNYEISA